MQGAILPMGLAVTDGPGYCAWHLIPFEFMDNLWEKLEERMNKLQEEEHFGGLDP